MRLKLQLSKNRFLWACFSRPCRKSRLWLVYLPESGAGFHPGSRRDLQGLVGRRLAEQFNLLVINKPGLNSDGVDRDVFERSFRRRLRIEDALCAIAAVIPRQDRVCLLGYSEGAYLAPQVALRLPGRVVAVGMIGGGTRGWLEEELSNTYGREKAALRRQIARIRGQGPSLEKWNGFSYATWNSYDVDSTLHSLKRLPKNIPMLSILGAKDKVIDFASALHDLVELNDSRTVHLNVLPSCGHSFSGHWGEVRRTLSRFLSDFSLSE